MVKENIVSKISAQTGYSRFVVSSIVDTLLNEITMELSRGEKVKFAGFGTFEPKKRAARTGRNPHTNEVVPIPARVMPVFKPGEHLKFAVSNLK